MDKVLIISSDESLNELVRDIIYMFDKSILVRSESKIPEALAFLNYELPNLVILNFGDQQINMYEALQDITSDLWLTGGGIIAAHSEPNEDEFLKKSGFANFLSVIHKAEAKSRLPALIKIILSNKDLILRREIPQHFSNPISFDFVIDNDPFDSNVYANLLSLYLYNANLIDLEKKNYLKNSLVELLMNAIEHGNCGIGFDRKTEAQAQGLSVLDLIREANNDPAIAAKRVYLSVTISEQESHFKIADDGEGFDWRKHGHMLDDDENRTLAHGRGIYMTKQTVRSLYYNDKGNEVQFDLGHQESKANLLPRIFQNKHRVDVHAGDVVLVQGDWSNFLSYILSGEFNVLDSRGKVFATLTTNDIFIGEMAFLLGNIRTATVQAATDGSLIRLTKREFVEAIKEFPYYGVFLARLLAQRLDKVNRNLFSYEQRSEDDYMNEAARALAENDFRKAVFVLKLGHKYFPANTIIQYHLAKNLVFFRKYNEALKHIRKYIEVESGDHRAYIIQGYSLYRTGQLPDAKESILKALELNDKDPNARYYLCRVWIKMDNRAEAKEALDELLKDNPDHPKLLRLAEKTGLALS